MSSTPLKILLSSMLLVGISSAHAQIPTPQLTPAANPPASVPVVPAATTATDQVAPFSPSEEKTNDVDNSSVQDLNEFQQTAQSIANSEAWRQTQRDEELAAGGFKWQPFSKAGPKVLQFVLERDPDVKYRLEPENIPFVDFAIADIDHDGQPDVLLYYWQGCGLLGCTYHIFYNDASREVARYKGLTLRPYKKGILLDGKGYFPIY